MLNIIRHMYSLSAFKRNTPEFINQMKQTGQPVVLTVNGEAELMVQDAASSQKQLDRIEQMETIVGIKRGLEDTEAGQIRPVEELEKEMLQKYGISS
jgi:PHD/YefM family antitoxin component YafN of YafNO toxin-antitoxin module